MESKKVDWSDGELFEEMDRAFAEHGADELIRMYGAKDVAKWRKGGAVKRSVYKTAFGHTHKPKGKVSKKEELDLAVQGYFKAKPATRKKSGPQAEDSFDPTKPKSKKNNPALYDESGNRLHKSGITVEAHNKKAKKHLKKKISPKVVGWKKSKSGVYIAQYND